MTESMLKEMRTTDIKTVEVTQLVNIEAVHVSADQDVYTRVQEFIEQIGNPYCFLVGNTPVKISFSNEDNSIDSAIFRYLYSLSE